MTAAGHGMSVTLAGLEPAIFASEAKRLIHYVGHRASC